MTCILRFKTRTTWCVCSFTCSRISVWYHMLAFWCHWTRIIMDGTTISGKVVSTCASGGASAAFDDTSFAVHRVIPKIYAKKCINFWGELSFPPYPPISGGTPPDPHTPQNACILAMIGNWYGKQNPPAPFLFCPTIVGQKQKVLTPKTLAYWQ